MRFKNDKNLAIVAEYCHQPAEQVSRDLCAWTEHLFREDTCFGDSVQTNTRDALVQDVAKSLYSYANKATGGKALPLKWEVFDAFRKLILMDEYDCPRCGGNLKYIETEGHHLNDGDRFTPPSYIIDIYVYRCPECGAYIKSKIEL